MLRASDLLTIPNGAFEDGVAVERTEEFWKSSQKRRLVCNKTFMQLIELTSVVVNVYVITSVGFFKALFYVLRRTPAHVWGL